MPQTDKNLTYGVNYPEISGYLHHTTSHKNRAQHLRLQQILCVAGSRDRAALALVGGGK